MTLQGKLDAIVAKQKGSFGVAVKHLQTGESAGMNESKPFQLASVFKVPILAALFRDVEEGRLQLDARIRLKFEERVPGSGVLQELDPGAEVSIKDLAMLMIIVSDNFATDQVLELVGIERVEQYMKQLGLEGTSIKHSCWRLLSQCVGIDEPKPRAETYKLFHERVEAGQFDKQASLFEASSENNVSTPQEINRLLEWIAAGKLVSPEASNGMLDIMLRQQLRNRIPYLLPERVKTATKSGTVGTVVNDVGIVFLPEDKGSFAISVLSHGNPTINEGQLAIAEITRAVYAHFTEG
ncbi:class A beta-lactamase-related serine hydrolase [Brevibacillus ruminantium]|uniref:Class A beta-lactamase-related serine hydrolase n=1 Tax=Brevibacillus ruminantium TaxID=2950604 RepID=A0ABY4WE50_9BACL|nr:serine hydrolase [Brevibacillus ruminantium]USG64060.1 class A beta-lactamase-related serine hydrolase [Brevibacillus ruminantium]